MLKLLMSVLFSSVMLSSSAQRITAEQYIEQYKDIAVSEMKRTGVPAAVTLAQGILETESGNSELVKKSNNHFGIKCKSTWTGASVTHDDDAIGECFRSYPTAEESFKDHSDFLHTNTRYGFLFKLAQTDYRGWAYGLKKAGYATNPRYPQILINNIEQYNLQQYTIQALSEMPGFDSARFANSKPEDAPLRPDPTGIKNNIDSSNDIPVNVPDKIIVVNKSKCVFAKKGTSLLAIATRNNINLVRLLDYNDLSSDGLLAQDQYVYLQKKSRTGAMDFYIVLPGETLYDIAQKNGIPLQDLAEYNLLFANDAVRPGTKLFLKPGLKTVDIETAPANKIKMHTVKPKELLYTIAKKYNVTVQQLKDWNKLNNEVLKTGQELIVSK